MAGRPPESRAASHAPHGEQARAWCRVGSFGSVEELRRGFEPGTPVLVSSPQAQLSGTLLEARLGGLGVVAGATQGAVRTTGRVLPDRLSLTIVLDCDGGSLQGSLLTSGALFVARPGEHVEGWSVGAYRWLTMLLTRRQVGLLTPLAPQGPGRLQADGLLRGDLPPGPLADARALARELWSASARDVQGKPPPGLVTAAHALVGVLARGWEEARAARASSRLAGTDAAVRRACARMLQGLDRPLPSVELCRAAGLPERTLEHAFRQRFGLSPKRYRTALRMIAARERLLRPGPGPPEPIAAVGAALGIRHRGRFVEAYRRYFGETPGATRQGLPRSREAAAEARAPRRPRQAAPRRGA